MGHWRTFVGWKPAALVLVAVVVGLTGPSTAAAMAPMTVKPSETYGRLPLGFERNVGQTASEAKFVARAPGYGVFLTATEAVMVLPGVAARAGVLRMGLVGGAPAARITGLDELRGRANYLIGKDPANWRTGVPTYGRVRYEQVYPGIDLLYYGNQRQLEHDFVVGPGADPAAITLRFAGAERVEIDAGGDLLLHLPGGVLRQRKPVVYQQVDGERRPVAGRYVRRGEDRVGFQVAAYDSSRPLVIDPVLVYSTYVGGSGFEEVRAIKVDAAGNAYIAGYSLSLDYPATVGAVQTSSAGGFDAFVTKLDATGAGLVYSTYLGGTGLEQAHDIAVDASGSAYVTGVTTSTNFPTTPGAFQPASGGGEDAFVTKLSADGSSLVYSTYLGGSASNEIGKGIAVDAAGSAYVTGLTPSTNFPTTPGAFAPVKSGGIDGFVTKLNGSGTGLVYSTYLGGTSDDSLTAVAIDAAGSAHVTGITHSTNFPTTPLAFQPTTTGTSNLIGVFAESCG